MADDIPALFESGIDHYFRKFGHRESREVPHQAWLMGSVSQFISPQLVVAELQLPNRDLAPHIDIPVTEGAFNFDFAVTRSEIDMRTWKTRTPGWNNGISSVQQTLETLAEVDVIAEFKIAKSKSTKTDKLIKDINKLRSVLHFLEQHNFKEFPSCYFVVLDPERILDIRGAEESTRACWPDFAPFPKLLVGPTVGISP